MATRKKPGTAIEETAVAQTSPEMEASAENTAVAVEEALEPAAETEAPEAAQLRMVPVRDLWLSDMNPRKNFDEESLEELAQSIREQGVLQPIVVRKKLGVSVLIAKPYDPQLYEVICGARRTRAAEKLGGDYLVPIIVRSLTDEQAFDLMITENLQRQDINVMEEARAFRQLYDRGQKQEEIAKRFGKSHVYVYQLIEISKCIPEIQQLVESGKFNKRVALQLAKMSATDQQGWMENQYNPDELYTEEKVKRLVDSYVIVDLRNAQFALHGFYALDEKVVNPHCLSCHLCSWSKESERYNRTDAPKCFSRSCFHEKQSFEINTLLESLPDGSHVNKQGISAGVVRFLNAHKDRLQIVNYDFFQHCSPTDAPDIEDFIIHAGAADEEEYDVRRYAEAQAAYVSRRLEFVKGNDYNAVALREGQVVTLDADDFTFSIRTKDNYVKSSEAPAAGGDAAKEADLAAQQKEKERLSRIAEIKQKLKRNEGLAKEKAYNELTKNIRGLALYGKLDHVDPQPPLTSAELVFFLSKIMPKDADDYSKMVLPLIQDKSEPYYIEFNPEKLELIADRILSWAVRKYLQRSYMAADGSNAGQAFLDGWLAIAKSLEDTNYDKVMTHYQEAYHKKGAALRRELEQLEMEAAE